MIRHMVLFTLDGFTDESAKTAHLNAIKTALEALPAEISALQSLHVGINCNPAEAPTFCLVAEVADMNALKAYATHPKHQKIVKELIAPYMRERRAIDYQA